MTGPRLTRTLAAALLGGLLALSGCAGSPESSGEAAEVSGAGGHGYHGAVITRAYPLPDQAFTDTAGRRFVPAEDADAPVTLLFFGYTHCPDVCNVVLANVASALRRADPAVRDRVTLLFVTTDPQRDTGEVIRGYLDRFDPSYVGLRAPLPTVKAAARSVGIAYGGTQPATGGGYEVSHGTQVIGFTGGQGRVVWSAETAVADLRADLTRLAKPGKDASGG